MSQPSPTPKALPTQQFHNSIIFSTLSQPISDLLLVVSLFFLFAGHQRPGGGFVGGLMASAVVVIRYLTGSEPVGGKPRRLGVAILQAPQFPLGLGLLLASSMAIWGVVVGSAALNHVSGVLQIPGVGNLTLSTTLIFDMGVYLVVVGLVATMLNIYGSHASSEVQP